MNDVRKNDRATCVAAGLIGLAVGDALGVPVEFHSRDSLNREPVSGMRANGTHNQPVGTWSDDSSLAFCLAESLCEAGISYHDQANRFIGWLLRAEWTPHGEVFDIGNATREAILRLDAGVEPTEAGPSDEFCCGNGSLMRILPIALFLAYADPIDRIEATMMCSRLTHGHIRCQLASVFFVEIAAEMVRGTDIVEGLLIAQMRVKSLINQRHPSELKAFNRLLSPGIKQLNRSEISGSGYVIHCLESSLWCSLRASCYSEGVLAAVNLGEIPIRLVP